MRVVQRGGSIDQRATTVMFTDIVGSTATAVMLGDRRWREVRNSHNDLIRHQLARLFGTELDTSGDGFLARFERPIDGVSARVPSLMRAEWRNAPQAEQP